MICERICLEPYIVERNKEFVLQDQGGFKQLKFGNLYIKECYVYLMTKTQFTLNLRCQPIIADDNTYLASKCKMVLTTEEQCSIDYKSFLNLSFDYSYERIYSKQILRNMIKMNVRVLEIQGYAKTNYLSASYRENNGMIIGQESVIDKITS